MPKVLLVSGPDPLKWKGGLETYLLNLYSILIEESYLVDIENFDNHKLDLSDLESYYMFSRIVQEKVNYYDLVIVNSIYSPFLKPSKNIIVISHGIYRSMAINSKEVIKKSEFLDFYYKQGMLEEFSYRNKNVVAVSSELMVDMRKYYNPQKIFLIRNAINTNLFKPKPEKCQKEGLLTGLYVGRADTTKGYDIFTEVYNRTKGYIRWIQCISTGGLGDCELIEEIETLRNIPNHAMPDVYNNSDFVLFPSRYEGFGLVTLEALACGKPVIAFNTGIFKTFSRFMSFLSIGSPIQDKSIQVGRILHILNNIIGNRELRGCIGKYGRSFVVKYFNMNIWKERWLRLLNTMI